MYDYIKDRYGKIISDYPGEASVITTRSLKLEEEGRRGEEDVTMNKSTERCKFFGFDDGRRGQ